MHGDHYVVSFLKDSFRFTPSWILSRRLTSFQRFFELGLEESASPFLDDRAKRISRNIMLKSSITAACLLVIAWVTSMYWNSPFWKIPATFVYLLVGTPALVAAGEDIFRRRDVNIDVLMTVAAFAALLIGGALEGALLLVLFALSGALEDVVTLKAKSALSAINELAPSKACVVEDGGFYLERAVADVRVGELIAVRAGEIVPLDGIVHDGSSSISTAHLTGESRPLFVEKGQSIVSGTRVLDGSIVVEVTCSSHDSTVTKLIGLITHAHATKPKLTQTFDRFGKVYALSVIGLTACFAALLPLAGLPFFGPGGALLRAVSFLITASPCALILAVPISYLSALGAAAWKGAILKGSLIFDRIVKCSKVAFDKTGTLTEGRLTVDTIIPLTQESFRSEQEVVCLAASLEKHAVHPIAHAICQKATSFLDVAQIQVVAGEGVHGVYQGVSLFVGGVDGALRRIEADVEQIKEKINRVRDEGFVVAVLVVGAKEAYLFGLRDVLRGGALASIQALKKLGKQVVMLTGDYETAAQSVARQLDVDDVRAGLTPEVKLEMVTQLSERGGLLMVGDGINDAPALARATVGMSMGQLSSATAREASDIVLLNNRLDVIAWLFRKAGTTRHIVTQNLFLACFAILVGTSSSLLGLLPLWTAVIIHEGSTLLVGLNALRLLSIKS